MMGLVHQLVENTGYTSDINYAEVAFYVGLFIVTLVVLTISLAWVLRRLSPRGETNPVYNNHIKNSYLSYMRVPTLTTNSVGGVGYSQGVER